MAKKIEEKTIIEKRTNKVTEIKRQRTHLYANEIFKLVVPKSIPICEFDNICLPPFHLLYVIIMENSTIAICNIMEFYVCFNTLWVVRGIYRKKNNDKNLFCIRFVIQSYLK